MKWGRRGRNTESGTLPSVKRGLSGKAGDIQLISCEICHRKTKHVLEIATNPHPRTVWKCIACKQHFVPGRLAG